MDPVNTLEKTRYVTRGGQKVTVTQSELESGTIQLIMPEPGGGHTFLKIRVSARESGGAYS